MKKSPLRSWPLASAFWRCTKLTIAVSPTIRTAICWIWKDWRWEAVRVSCSQSSRGTGSPGGAGVHNSNSSERNLFNGASSLRCMAWVHCCSRSENSATRRVVVTMRRLSGLGAWAEAKEGISRRTANTTVKNAAVLVIGDSEEVRGSQERERTAGPSGTQRAPYRQQQGRPDLRTTFSPPAHLPSIERAAEGLVATATARILPVHLDQPVVGAEGLVVRATPNRAGDRTKLPCILIGIFGASGVVPRVEIRIGQRLLGFMGHDRGHTVRAIVVVGADGLHFASGGTPVRIADERVLNVGTRDARARMPTAVVRAETGGLRDI